jgi:predicted SnoaL-like aldol condensation-catalyzing enzyme
MSADAKATVERMIAAANQGNWAAAEEIFAPDFHSHPLGTTGTEPIRDRWKQLFASFPDLRVIPQRMISDGDRVALWSKIENAPGYTEMMELIRVADGRIAELWAVRER